MKVPARRDQHVAENSHRQPLSRIGHELQKGGEVAILRKDVIPAITTIEHMVTKAADRSASSARHVANLLQTAQSVNKVECPHCHFPGGPRRRAYLFSDMAFAVPVQVQVQDTNSHDD